MRLGEVAGASRARADGPLKLAVPRGALFDGTLDLLDRDRGRHRRAARRLALAVFEADGLVLVTMRPSDVPDLRRGRRRRPRHHRQGRAARAARPRRLRAARPRLRRLPDGARRRAGATTRLGEAERRLGAMRIATKYPRIAERYFEETGRQAEVIEVKGSVELAPLVGPRRRHRRPRRHRPDARRERPRGARGDRQLHGAPRRQPGRPQAARRRGRRAGRADAGGDRMRIERIDWDGRDAPALAARLRALAPPPEEVADDVAEIVGSRPRPAATRPLREIAERLGEEAPESLAGGPGRDRGGPRAARPRRARGAAARGAEHRRGRARGARGPRRARPRSSCRRGSGSRFATTPVAAAGVYAPGGRAAYPSTVLMCCIPARVAGVSRVAVASPPGAARSPQRAGAGGLRARGRRRGLRDRRRPGDRRARATAPRRSTAVDVIAGPGQPLRRRGQAPGLRRGRDRRHRGPERADGRRRRHGATRSGSRSTSAPRPSTATDGLLVVASPDVALLDRLERGGRRARGGAAERRRGAARPGRGRPGSRRR